jgi:hypothetical protein
MMYYITCLLWTIYAFKMEMKKHDLTTCAKIFVILFNFFLCPVSILLEIDNFNQEAK